MTQAANKERSPLNVIKYFSSKIKKSMIQPSIQFNSTLFVYHMLQSEVSLGVFLGKGIRDLGLGKGG